MKENLTITKICQGCEGKGWRYYPNFIFKRQNQRCRKCHGTGFARYKERIYYSKPKKFANFATVDYYKYTKRYREKDKKHWNSTQRKYRRGNKEFLEKYRLYLKNYRAMKKAKEKPKPYKRNVIKYKFCIKNFIQRRCYYDSHP